MWLDFGFKCVRRRVCALATFSSLHVELMVWRLGQPALGCVDAATASRGWFALCSLQHASLTLACCVPRQNVAVRTNIAGWNFLNPLSLDFVSLKTQFFLDRDRTPVGGYLKVFGYVVLSLASRNGGKGLFHHPNSHGRPNILGHGEGYYRPAGQRFGACHIHSQNFEGLSKSYEKWKDIVQPNCIKKYGHEWYVSLVCFICHALRTTLMRRCTSWTAL